MKEQKINFKNNLLKTIARVGDHILQNAIALKVVIK